MRVRYILSSAKVSGCCAGIPEDETELEAVVAKHHAAIGEVMLKRTTQTNEPGRCAVLLPALTGLRQPLALLEVGAAAGLCLLIDRYGYDYGHRQIPPALGDGPAVPIFPCTACRATPLPSRVPKITWRRGLDLNPLNVASPSDMGWLHTLVWPNQAERAERLQAAIEIDRHHTPRVIQGNLLTDLAGVARQAPSDAQLVIFHTAVLSYVPTQEDRDAFAQMVRHTGAVWISNEAPSVFPEIAARVPQPQPQGKFLLAINGEPVAWTAPHGQSIEWFSN